MKKTRITYNNLELACKMLDNSSKYVKTKFLKESIYAKREFKDFLESMPVYYRKGYKAYDMVFFLFEENNQVWFKVIGVHNCMIDCCGGIWAEKEKFSLRKVKRFLGRIVYTNKIIPMYEQRTV